MTKYHNIGVLDHKHSVRSTSQITPKQRGYAKIAGEDEPPTKTLTQLRKLNHNKAKPQLMYR